MKSYQKHQKKFIITSLLLILILVVFIKFISKEPNDLIEDNIIKSYQQENSIILESKIEELEGVKSSNSNEQVEISENNELIEDKIKKKNYSEDNIKNQKKDFQNDFVQNDLEVDLSSPRRTILNLHQFLKKVNNMHQGYKKLLILIQSTYNVPKMSSMILGDNWKKYNFEQKKIFLNVFEEYITRNYVKRFAKINIVEWKIKSEKKINDKYYLVNTILKINNEEVSIDYLLSEVNKSWKIFDVLLGGSISEIATKKSEFHSFTKTQDLSQLIKALKRKNLDLRNR